MSSDIAAKFEKGDYEILQDLSSRLKAQCFQVYSDEWQLLRRMTEAASIAEYMMRNKEDN